MKSRREQGTFLENDITRYELQKTLLYTILSELCIFTLCRGSKYIRVIIMDLRRKIISLHIYKRSVTSAEKAFVNQCLEHNGGQKIRLDLGCKLQGTHGTVYELI